MEKLARTQVVEQVSIIEKGINLLASSKEQVRGPYENLFSLSSSWY